MKTETKVSDFNKKSLLVSVDDGLKAAIMGLQARGVKMTPPEIVKELLQAAATNQAPRFVVLQLPDQAEASLRDVESALKTFCKGLTALKALKPGKDKEAGVAKIFSDAVDLWALTQRLAKIRLLDANQIDVLRKAKELLITGLEDLDKNLKSEPENSDLKARRERWAALIDLLTKLGI